MFNSTTLEQALSSLGQVLLDRSQHYEVVAIGAGSLLLLGQITRTTKDFDLIALVDNGEFISPKPLPGPLSHAITEVGYALNIGKDWMNAAPSDLFDMELPEGFKTRMHTLHFGGLTVHLAERLDQICFKLYAAVNQGPDSIYFADLKSLKPTAAELEVAIQWCKSHLAVHAITTMYQLLLFAL